LTLAALQSGQPQTALDTFLEILPWAGGGIIFLAAVLIALRYWWARRVSLTPEPAAPVPISIQPAATKSGGTFCSNCGAQVAPGARFCQVCGTDLHPYADQDQTNAEELEILSKREKEVLTLVAQGMTSPEIGEKLGISPKTVSRHRERIMKKLDTSNVADLVKFAIRTGLVELE
jgi:DNA-binding CsgD family transcriptional regulator